MPLFPHDLEVRIGFATVRAQIATLALCELGRRGVLESAFSTDPHTIAHTLDLLHEFKELLMFHPEFPREGYLDFTPNLKVLLSSQERFTPGELVVLHDSLATIEAIVAFFAHDGCEYRALRVLSSTAVVPEGVCRQIERLVDQNGVVRDSASPALQKIRRVIYDRQGQISRIMAQLLRQGQQQGLIDESAQVQMRDGKPVLPVPAGSKRQFQALELGRSATGQTVYLQPYEALEAQNEIANFQQQEAEEIARILSEFTEELRPHHEALKGCYALLGQVDTLRAKALFSTQVGGARPILADEPTLRLRAATHPLLVQALATQGKKPVPLDLNLDGGERILVISGPNAGGKSVALKTAATAVYMVQCGFLPLAGENSEISVFQDIFVDIGDAQSMESDLSTYSSHLLAMRYFTEHAGARSLCLIDELGSGTEPTAGGAIAETVLEELANSHCLGIVTTHFANLKHCAEQTEGLVNGAMRFDTRNLRPLYSLDQGMPGSSFPFEIARKMGLPREFIARAEALAGREYISLERQLHEAANQKKLWSQRRQEADALYAQVATLKANLDKAMAELAEQRRQIVRQAKDEASRIVRESNRVVERTIREIRESAADREKTKAARGALQEFQSALLKKAADDGLPEALSKPMGAQGDALAGGDFVRIAGTTSTGQIVSATPKRAVVAIGQVMTTVPIDRLERISGAEFRKADRNQRQQSGLAVDSLRQRRLNFHSDFDVRGMRGEEALQEVQDHIDDALMVGVQHLRILHGKGDGILRSRIRELLRSLPTVESFADESEQLGGAGVTIVKLR